MRALGFLLATQMVTLSSTALASNVGPRQIEEKIQASITAASNAAFAPCLPDLNIETDTEPFEPMSNGRNMAVWQARVTRNDEAVYEVVLVRTNRPVAE